MKIGIIKYGLGNIGSVYQSLKNVNSYPVILLKYKKVYEIWII